MVSPDSRVNLARRQAETPLIALFRFLRPALCHGIAHPCPVTNAAFRNVRHRLREKFQAWEREKKEEKANRRKTERLFLIDPRRPPLLIDEPLFISLHEFRTANEVPATEQRLRELGFQVEVQGNVVAYKLMHENRLVLADPRFVGRLEFHVFSDEKPIKKTKVNPSICWTAGKHIPAKFRARLIKACSTFPPHPDS